MNSGTANGFSINLPQIFANGNASPAFALNFDFGANPSQIAQQAYSFVNQSFSNDQNFLSASISGTQTFLSHQIAPVINADTAQINQNATALPSLYKMLSNTALQSITAINSNVLAGTSAQTAAFNASIASSNASANSGGGFCFITTAVCHYRGLQDDCPMLQKFRAFRDGWMKINHPDKIREYYAIAPDYVERISTRRDASWVYERIWEDFLRPAELALDVRDYISAYEIYCELVTFAGQCADCCEDEYS